MSCVGQEAVGRRPMASVRARRLRAEGGREAQVGRNEVEPRGDLPPAPEACRGWDVGWTSRRDQPDRPAGAPH
ncbi:MAG: hypothetical protein NC048_02260 [Bacteroides sp.]|nr:hypothetical protein [Ruminococcus flavefaciens]MCM1554300.1 hypothetical protein [Bacteroides sp.]